MAVMGGFDLMDTLGGAPAAHERALERPLNARCRVTKPLPKDGYDPLWVVPVGYATSRPYEVVAGHWQTHGSTLPDLRNVCLVITDHEGDLWAVSWEDIPHQSFLSGHGAPVPADGLDGDVWLDLDSRNFYGPKNSAGSPVWPGLGRLDPFDAPYPDPV